MRSSDILRQNAFISLLFLFLLFKKVYDTFDSCQLTSIASTPTSYRPLYVPLLSCIFNRHYSFRPSPRKHIPDYVTEASQRDGSLKAGGLHLLCFRAVQPPFAINTYKRGCTRKIPCFHSTLIAIHRFQSVFICSCVGTFVDPVQFLQLTAYRCCIALNKFIIVPNVTLIVWG